MNSSINNLTSSQTNIAMAVNVVKDPICVGAQRKTSKITQRLSTRRKHNIITSHRGYRARTWQNKFKYRKLVA